jgi:hypothetical protein
MALDRCPVVAKGVGAELVERVTGIEPASRAWKARPGSRLSRDPTPMAQVRSGRDRPLLTVRDRQMPMLRARGGHGRRGRTRLQPGGDGHNLNRRVRPVRGDHLPRWQEPGGLAAAGLGDSNSTSNAWRSAGRGGCGGRQLVSYRPGCQLSPDHVIRRGEPLSVP